MASHKRPRVLVTSYYERALIEPCLEPLRDAADVIDGNRNRNYTLDEIYRAIPGMHVTIAADEPYPRQLFERAGDLLLVARDGAGYDKIDLRAATDHGVVVTRAPVVIDATANMTLGLMIALVRKITFADRAIRRGGWTDRASLLCPGLTAMTLGILGLGRVGRKVATRARALGMKVLAYGRGDVSEVAHELGVEAVSLDDLLAQSHVVSVHLRSTPETRGLCSAAFFAKMMAGSYFLNTSRGQIVNEAALVSVLESGHLAGAALDVFDREPIDPENPLLSMDTVILTPHVAGDTATSMVEAIDMNVAQIIDLFAGRKPSNILNPDVWNWARIHQFIREG